jgi:hypothetical protein
MLFRKSIFVLSVCALLACGSAAQAGYIDNGDGTVTDNGTGLMWQQVTAPDNYTWEQALAYCDNLSLAGHTDWRLPTAKELVSIVDTTQFNPSINTTYFSSRLASYYWSSTTDTYSINTIYAWFVYFGTGYLAYGDKTDYAYVRAVRAGQSGSFADLILWPVPDTGQSQCYDNNAAIACPSSDQAFYGQDASYSINTPAYTKLASGCTALPDNATTWAMVRDEVTGLVWEEKHAKDSVKNYEDPNDADNTYTWYDNNSTTNGGDAGTPSDGNDTMDFIRTLNSANYGGFSDWRIPTEKELQTIVDYGLSYPSINMVYFPNTVADLYWSSHTDAYNTAYAWSVYFNVGNVSFSDKSSSDYIRAVRGGQCAALGNLIISKLGTGAGTVTSADGKIDCGSDCSAAYPSCAEVTLTALAFFGSTFAGWSGGVCSGTGQCVVTMTDNRSVTANFDLVPTTTTTEPTTTTTTAAPCIDNDGDGYGENCAAGPDCNDNDPFYNTICPDCTVKVIPRALGWFLGEKEKTRLLFVIGNRGTEYDDTTSVIWETSDITVLSKHVLFKRFMFMKVSIDAAALGKGDYRFLIGNCSGQLTLVK